MGLLKRMEHVPFGPADGAVLTYRSETRDAGRREHFEWSARENEMVVVVGLSHLRRVRLRTGEATIVELSGYLTTQPGLDGAAQSLTDEVWTFEPFRPRIAPLVSFEEQVESSQWALFRSGGNVIHDPRNRTLRGRVLGRDGALPSQFCVQVRGPVQSGAVTHKDGSYELQDLPPGEYEVTAGSIDGGDVTVRTTIGKEDAVVDLQLSYGPSLRGRVVDTSGNAVAGARLLWWTRGGALREESTNEDGAFFMPRLTHEPGQLWACVPGEVGTVELPAVGRPISPGDDIELVLDRNVCRGSLRVHVALPAGVAAEHVTARIWQQSSGLGVRLVRDLVSTGLVFGRDAIPAGSYRVELYCPGLGRIYAGEHRIDGVHRLDLRDVAFPAPSSVTFVPPPERAAPAQDDFEIVRRGSAVDHRLPTEAPFGGPHLLGPGDYVLHWRDNGELRSHTFAVDATAGSVRVDLK